MKLPVRLLRFFLLLCAAVHCPVSVLAQLPQTISWDSPATEILLLNEPKTLTANASSGLPVTFRLKAGPAVIAGRTVTATQVGTIVLIAEQAGDKTYAPASVTRVFNRSSIDVSLAGEWPGYLRGNAVAVEVVNKHAYVSLESGGLAIFDVSDDSHPSRVGGFGLDWSANEVSIEGSRAYVAAGFKVEIFDISSPAVPTRLGAYDRGWYAYGIHVVDSIAYVPGTRDGQPGLEVLNVSDPSNPKVIGRCNTAGPPLRVRVDRGFAYLACAKAGLKIADVGNPASPTIMATVKTTGWIQDVSVDGHLAYVADRDKGLEILDITNPLSPQKVGHFDSGPGYASYGDVAVSGNRAFLTNIRNGLQVLDLTDPSNPQPIGNLGDGNTGQAVQIVGNRAYLVDPGAGLRIVDVTDSTKPTTMGSFETHGFALGIHVVGEAAYLSDLNRLQIIDVADRFHPTRLGQFKVVDGGPFDASVVGSVGYVAFASAGLQILDLTDPATPHLLGGLGGMIPVEVELRGSIAYLGDDRNVLHVVDVIDPAHPVKIGEYPLRHPYTSSQIVGDRLYYRDQLGLQILSLADPVHPALIGGYDSGGFVSAMHVVDSLAYLATDRDGFVILDVNNPASPIRLGSLGGIQGGWRLKVQGRFAYLVGHQIGLRVYEVSDPTNPVEVGGYPNLRDARDIQLIGDMAYVADGPAGLQVLELREAIRQTISFVPPTSVTLAHPSLMLEATANSGLPLTFTLVSGPASLVGNKLNFTGLGPVVIRVVQAGSAQFLPVTVERTIHVVEPPVLTLHDTGSGLLLSWPAVGVSDVPDVVEFATTLGSLVEWNAVNGLPLEVDGIRRLFVPRRQPAGYYRVRR